MEKMVVRGEVALRLVLLVVLRKETQVEVLVLVLQEEMEVLVQEEEAAALERWVGLVEHLAVLLVREVLVFLIL